jgi:YgiT-type zinc finger domain-containing protein
MINMHNEFNITTCPICDSKAIHKKKGTIIQTIKDRRISIPNVEHWFCENCGERLYPPFSVDLMSKYIKSHSGRKKTRVA